MSPAISLVKPLAKQARPCPYCDHFSPPDSKFCGACGAALHLVPCPHCGAVNDITTTTACYRCHRELQEASATAPPAVAVPAEPEPVVVAESVPTETQGRQRPHGLVVLIVLLAFAAASYYAFRQRGTFDMRETAPASAEVKGRVNPADGGGSKTPAATVSAPAVMTPAAPAKIEKPVVPDTTPASSVQAKPGPALSPALPMVRAARNAAATEPATPAENSRVRTEAVKGLERQLPNIGPCTDAVAALGLCTPEPTPKR